MLDDWTAAPVGERARAALAFLRKLTLTPTEVNAQDVEELRAARVSDEAIADAVAVCTLFNLIDRVSDALDFHLLSPEQTTLRAKLRLERGYRM